jgi:putative tryptophan/tyrosine transport system substrate-binding protein
MLLAPLTVPVLTTLAVTVIGVPGATFVAESEALFTFENNLPFMAPASRFVKKGALVALMVDYEDIGKQAGEMAKKIIGGTAPSAMPIEQPRATILVLNQKTAQTIGINIPPALLESSQIIK